MKRKRPLDRSLGLLRDASLIVIASEDTYAVRQYFEFFESRRIQFVVLESLDRRSAPEHVLGRLRDYLDAHETAEEDSFWVVCDSDHWIGPGHIKNLAGVLQKSRQRAIQVEVSNPCFDLWLLLHFADFPEDEALTCDEVARRLRASAGSYDKTKVSALAITLDSVSEAVRRAKGKHPVLEEIPTRPQTGVHRIIADSLDRQIISIRPPPVPATAKVVGKKKRKK